MADILIKNIELPTEDEQVNITILSDGSVIEHFRNESGKWSSYRSGGVTAIELPPHGDLGDLSEVSMTLYSELETQTPKTLGEVMQIIKRVFDEAPTVLEAST